ncbi:UHRF1-binding protein 1 isoform X2 [Xenopus laevis]|nr:UHRF1-binding protein 1 isoform X2 [Xenopus laevis]
MLDLPTWLAITRIYCNRASIRIQWTKLKTHPICLMLDKVEVDMKTCEDPRPPNGPSPIALASGQSEYGFAEKVVEGMFLEVGCVVIKIESRTFHASLQLWQLQGYSVSPNWQKTDLRFTRLTHPDKGEVLTFKEVIWQTLRVEADASENSEDVPSTPLRLLTSGGRLHVALKRRMKDCLVLCSKFTLLLDELLWVLTDSQLRALLSYAKSLSEAVQKSVRQRKDRGEEQVASSPTVPSLWSLSSSPSTTSSLGQYFDKFDMKETSYHLLISKLDLHVCDERPPQGTCTVAGGAIQLTLCRVILDYYPSHREGQSVSHWHCVSPAIGTCERWTQDLAEEKLSRKEPNPSANGTSPIKQNKMSTSSPPLYFFCVLIRVDNIDIYQISSSGQAAQKPPLLSCGQIPYSFSAIHFQYMEYYHLPGQNIPVPSPALYIQLHGLMLCLAVPSILWLNQFMLDMYQHIHQFAEESNKAREHRDVRLDGFNLKLNFPVVSPLCQVKERPHSIYAHLAVVTITNTRQGPGSTLYHLQQCFRLFASKPSFHCPLGPLHPIFLSHVFPSSSPPSSSLWSLHSPSLSLYFKEAASKKQILMNSLPFTAWACLLHPENQLDVLFNVESLAKLKLNHYQYLTLLRAQEQLQALLEELQNMVSPFEDHDLVKSTPARVSVCVGLLIPEVRLSLLLPSSFAMGNPSESADSEQSSLICSEPTVEEIGSELEKVRLSIVNVEEGVNTQGAMEAAEERHGDSAVQQLEVTQEKNVLLMKDIVSEAVQEMQMFGEAIQKKENTQGIFLGKEFAKGTLLSTIGRTRETLNLGKEKMQRFLKDTKQKDQDLPLSRTESQQSLDRFSLEGFDAVSLDDEAGNAFLHLLDTESSHGSQQTEKVTGSGKQLTDQDNVSQITEEPEPQEIMSLSLTDVISVARVQENDVTVTLQAMKLSCGPRSGENEGPLEVKSPTTPLSKPHVSIQFNIGSSVASQSPVAKQNGFLQLWIQNFTSELSVSSLTHIGPFLEDEQLGEIVPLNIHISNSSISLRDNGPSLYSSPLPPQPVILSVQNIKVQRKEDGIFVLTGDDTNAALPLANEEVSLLPQSKEELQRELIAAQIKLDQQNEQQQRLLQEIRKYNPDFQL